jgi:hypothetical protein
MSLAGSDIRTIQFAPAQAKIDQAEESLAAGLRMRAEECGQKTCGQKNAGRRMRAEECGQKNAGRRMQAEECRQKNAGRRMQAEECRANVLPKSLCPKDDASSC